MPTISLTWTAHYCLRHTSVTCAFYPVESLITYTSINMLSTLALLLAPALVSAHGAVTSYKIAGKEYPGYEVSRAMQSRRRRPS